MRLFPAFFLTLRDWSRLIGIYFSKGGDVVDPGSRDIGVAVVLGAQVLRGGRPSGTLSARTLHAAKLYDGGRISHIVVTGGVGENPPSEADVMAGILAGAGVPEAVVEEECSAKTTWESAINVSRMMSEAGVSEVVVITDPLHCPRTVAAFGERGLRAIAEPVYESPSWRSPKMRREQLFREMGASVWYRFGHRVGTRL